jgi:hypothetical protein
LLDPAAWEGVHPAVIVEARREAWPIPDIRRDPGEPLSVYEALVVEYELKLTEPACRPTLRMIYDLALTEDGRQFVDARLEQLCAVLGIGIRVACDPTLLMSGRTLEVLVSHRLMKGSNDVVLTHVDVLRATSQQPVRSPPTPRPGDR